MFEDDGMMNDDIMKRSGVYCNISPFLYTLHLNFWFEGREQISAFEGAL